MPDEIFHSFLRRQLAEAARLEASSDVLRLRPVRGAPPTHYLAEFRGVRGWACDHGRIVEQKIWRIGIAFPDHYLREPVDVATVLTYLGPAPEPWHPNIRPPFLCLHLGFGAMLPEIVYGIHDLLTWALYSTYGDGLNPRAAQWARNQDPRTFPTDLQPLKRRGVALAVPPRGTEEHR